MLSVFVCEDDKIQREKLEKIIRNVIMIEELEMEFTLSTGDIKVLLELVKKLEPIGLYFLDIDLQQELNGMELASEIRKYDTFGKIVFLTSHTELMPLAFQYRVEALDYIIKSEEEAMRLRVYECMKLASERHKDDRFKNKHMITIKIGNQLRTFKVEDILFIETSTKPHRLVLNLINEQIEYYGNIKDVEKYGFNLTRCHRSFVVNKDNVSKINKNTLEVEMNDGSIIYASTRGIKKLH